MSPSKLIVRLEIVAHVLKSSTWEADLYESKASLFYIVVQGQPDLQSETLSEKTPPPKSLCNSRLAETGAQG